MMFSHHFRDQVLSQFDDVGLRGLVGAYPDAIQEIALQHAEILRDMDDPEDYARELDAWAKTERQNDQSSVN